MAVGLSLMTIHAFPPDDPATVEAEELLGEPGSPLRDQVRTAAAAAQRGEHGISASEVRARLTAGRSEVADELRFLDGEPSETGLDL